MSDPDQPSTHQAVPVEFTDERFTPEETAAHEDWRELTDYERAVLNRLLEANFPGHSEVAAEAQLCRVRQIDRCGCLEFDSGASVEGETTIVAEGSGPLDEQGSPVEIMLTLRAGHLLWLEFHRYGGRNDFLPDAELFEVGPWPNLP